MSYSLCTSGHNDIFVCYFTNYFENLFILYLFASVGNENILFLFAKCSPSQSFTKLFLPVPHPLRKDVRNVHYDFFVVVYFVFVQFLSHKIVIGIIFIFAHANTTAN